MILFILLLTPLAAAGVSFAARTRRVMEATNLIAFSVTFMLAIVLVGQVSANQPVSLWQGFLYCDSLSALVVLLTSFVSLASSVYAIGYFRHRDQTQSDEEDLTGAVTLPMLRRYYSLTPLFAFCMLLVAVANNLGVMWVAIEGTTLASVFLVTFYGRPTSLEAAWKYAMIGGVGLSMALFGTILTYYSAHGVLGTETLSGLNWSILVVNAAQFDKNAMRLAFILILLGYGTKAGIAPMHTWKPDAYSEAPVPVAAMMATAVLNCALYGLARFYVLAARCLGTEFLSQLLILFGLLSMAVAVPFILVQRSFRRLLAYSSIDHGGIMILGLGFGGALGSLGMLLHMTFHTVAKPLLFFCAGSAQQHMGTDLFRKARGGLIHSMPITGVALLMTSLAVTGAPPFSIFQSEFTILRAAFQGHHILPAVLFVGFVIAIFSGFLMHISKLVFGPSLALGGDTDPWKTYAVVGLAVSLVILAFWLPAPIFNLVERAAQVVTVLQ